MKGRSQQDDPRSSKALLGTRRQSASARGGEKCPKDSDFPPLHTRAVPPVFSATAGVQQDTPFEFLWTVKLPSTYIIYHMYSTDRPAAGFGCSTCCCRLQSVLLFPRTPFAQRAKVRWSALHVYDFLSPRACLVSFDAFRMSIVAHAGRRKWIPVQRARPFRSFEASHVTASHLGSSSSRRSRHCRSHLLSRKQ